MSYPYPFPMTASTSTIFWRIADPIGLPRGMNAFLPAGYLNFMLVLKIMHLFSIWNPSQNPKFLKDIHNHRLHAISFFAVRSKYPSCPGRGKGIIFGGQDGRTFLRDFTCE